MLPVSALTGAGMDRVWDLIAQHRDATTGSGERAARRAEQAGTALWGGLADSLLDALRGDAAVAAALPGIEARVRRGETSPAAGGRLLLELFLRRDPAAG